MTYLEALEYLFSATPVFQHIGGEAYKPGLDRVEVLAREFGNPHTQLRSIHVGGTNGKGSVSHTLASILQAEGYSVGLFTSPHLVDFRERIRVNGTMVPPEWVANFVEQARESVEHLWPSFFELTTVMALCYFAHRSVDYAIIEVGLGGRLDSTNIITPLVSVISSISFDHMQYLGSTLSAIAREKAGIIKKNVPIVIGGVHSDEVLGVFVSRARQMDSSIYFAEEQESGLVCHRSPCVVHYDSERYGRLESPLVGWVQLHNMRTVLATVSVLQGLGVAISIEGVANGVREVVRATGLQGRWQWLLYSPRVICDTAHNEDGIRHVVAQLLLEDCARLHLVLGFAQDKDLSSILSLFPQDARYYFAKPSVARGLPSELLQTKAWEYGLMGEAFTSVAEAVDSAIAAADADRDLIFIGGSNFVVADILSAWEKDRGAGLSGT